MFNGKRTNRFRVPKQIRADEDMIRAIQVSADESNRDFSRQLFHFVSLGIVHEKECESKSPDGTSGHLGISQMDHLLHSLEQLEKAKASNAGPVEVIRAENRAIDAALNVRGKAIYLAWNQLGKRND